MNHSYFQIVKDDALKQVIRNRIALKQPYVGVFVKQDDEFGCFYRFRSLLRDLSCIPYTMYAFRNKEEIVTSLSQLFNVGCFAQVRLGPALFRLF